MNHFQSFDEVNLESAWTTIGAFDGVHRGHQAILLPMIEAAHRYGAPAVVVTFHPHPQVVLRGVQDPIYLTSTEERARLLGELGVDAVVTLTFDRALASLTAEDFMIKMKRHLGLASLWVGHDFALGRNRQGDIATLAQIGERLGYSLRVTDEVNLGQERISSSRIRELLRTGSLDKANQMLGRPYSIEGEVIHGDGRGRGLGYPTANVNYWPGKLVPSYGVYATWTLIGGRRIPSATSVGVRPTFDHPPAQPRVEAYLFDFDEDLYGQTARVEFQAYLRPELRFESVQALIAQMGLDTQKAREVLAHA